MLLVKHIALHPEDLSEQLHTILTCLCTVSAIQVPE